MKLKKHEVWVAFNVYRMIRFAGSRAFRKGGIMASKKKVGILAAITAALGALFFWRKRRSRQSAEL